jgi:hypothetical protein
MARWLDVVAATDGTAFYNLRGPGCFPLQPGRRVCAGISAGMPARALGMTHAVRSCSDTMKDLLFCFITVGFFAVSWLYTKACDRL